MWKYLSRKTIHTRVCTYIRTYVIQYECINNVFCEDHEIYDYPWKYQNELHTFHMYTHGNTDLQTTLLRKATS